MIRFIIVSVLVISSKGIQQPRLVYPRLLEERSADGRMVLHLHDQLTLNLRKASVAARNFRVLEHEDGHEVTHIFNGKDIEQSLHEDEKQFATVHVTSRGSGVEVEGVVGPYHRIEPMPEMERSDQGLIPHMIHEIEKKEMLDIEVAPSGKDAWIVSERTYGAESVPVEVTIEIFMVSDLLHYKHFKSTFQLINYLCIQINSVNMRYTDTSQPRVKFLLVGVEKDQYSTYKNGSGILMESSSTLDEFRLYAYNKRYEYGYPDMVYLMTGHEVYSEDSAGTRSMNVLGIGFLGGLCTHFFVALGEDIAGLYTGMHTLTHEAAHVLGAAHDESKPKPWIKDDPGSLACLWSEGYIMSYVDGGTKHHRFSACSLKQIQNLVVLRGSACWRVGNPGHTNKGRYPGMEVAPNQLCKSVFPDKDNVTADMNSDRMEECMVKCQYPIFQQHCRSIYGRQRCYTYTTIKYVYQHALDYMPCTAAKVCVRGVCGGSMLKVPQAPVTESTTPEATTTPTADGTTECRCDCDSTKAITSTYPPRRTTPSTTARKMRWNGLIRRHRQ